MALSSPINNNYVTLLVTNEEFLLSDKIIPMETPNLNDTEGVYNINWNDTFSDIISKMTKICKKTVTRMYYIDDDNDEVPIDSEVEYKEALKFIGERTKKGKFTTLRIEAGGSSKSMKKKVKKAKVKISSKANDQTSLKVAAPKKASTETKSRKSTSVDETSVKMGKPPAWFGDYMKQFKSEFMAEVFTNFESLLKPLVDEQKNLSSLIGSNALGGMDVKPSTSNNMKVKPTESDHNYSAMANSKKGPDNKRFSKRDNDRTKVADKIYENVPFNQGKNVGNDFNANECCGLQCDTCCYGDDDNLSIYSGEISVTDSESEVEGAPEDFVDVPLPSCFNVVAHQGAQKSEQKEKVTKNSEASTRNQEVHYKCQLKADNGNSTIQNAAPIKKPDLKKDNGKKSFVSSKQGTVQPVKKCITASIKHSGVDLVNECSQCLDNEEYGEVEDDFVEEGEENGQDFDDDYDDYDEDFDDYVENIDADNGHRMPSSDQQGNVPYTSQVAEQHSTQSVNCTVPHLVSATASRVPLLNGQPRQQPQKTMPATNAVSQQPNYRLLEAQAAVQAQHQQVVQAAQRAAIQAQQAQALALGPSPNQLPIPEPAPRPVPFPESSMQNNFQGETVTIGVTNPRTKSTCSANRIPCSTTILSGAPQEVAQELKLWNEVDQVDRELHKWVQMCQQLMEAIPKRGDGSSNMPESLKKLASNAVKTHQDLEKVYQKFRKEVRLVSTQMDALKQQREHQQSPEPLQPEEQPIAILPEKLMQVISATLNTTFNILGNIAKLGVTNASNSGPSEPRTPAQDLPKGQAQVSSQVPSQVTTQVTPQNPPQVIPQVTPQGPPQVTPQVTPLVPPQGPPQGPPTGSSHGLSQGLSRGPSQCPPQSTSQGPQRPSQRHPQVPSQRPPQVLPQGPPQGSSQVPAPANTNMTQVSSTMSPMTSTLGTIRVGYSTQTLPYAYYYHPYLSTLPNEAASGSACGLLTDALGNQDASVTYRMRPVGASAAYGSTYPMVWGSSVPAYTPASALSQGRQDSTTLKFAVSEFQPQTQTQPPVQIISQAQIQHQAQPQLQMPQQQLQAQQQQLQAQQQQLQAQQKQHQLQAQQQLQLQVQQQLQQQLQVQLQQPLLQRQLQPQMQPQQLPRDGPGNQMDTTFVGVQPQNRNEVLVNGPSVHDFTPNAPEAHNTQAFTLLYPNLNPVSSGFCMKTFGGLTKP